MAGWRPRNHLDAEARLTNLLPWKRSRLPEKSQISAKKSENKRLKINNPHRQNLHLECASKNRKKSEGASESGKDGWESGDQYPNREFMQWVGIEGHSFALVFLPGFGMQRYPSPPVNTTRLTTAAATSKPHFLPLTSGDSIRASVSHLLTRAFSLPCSTAALAFTQLVQPTSRFQLALDALLPLLDSNTTAEVRVLISSCCQQGLMRISVPS